MITCATASAANAARAWAATCSGAASSVAARPICDAINSTSAADASVKVVRTTAAATAASTASAARSWWRRSSAGPAAIA